MTASLSPPERSPWPGLCAVLSLVLLVAMDGSVLYLAMPRITAALSPTADQALWILDVYGFVVGSLLIAFGNLGDRYGRLRLMRAGAAVFGLGSLGAAFSTSAESLIAYRALMGLGGATLLPSGLAVLGALFPDPRRRAQAIGIFAATFAAGFAIGPMVGGLLLSLFDWGAVFLINIPVVLAFLAAAPVFLKEARAPGGAAIDLPSLILSALGLLLLVFAIKASAAHGLGAGSMTAGILGAVLLALFLKRQGRIPNPLLDLELFRDPVFSRAILTGLLSLVVWSAVGYLGGIYLQSVLGFSVLQAALLTLPGALMLTLSCLGASRIVERIGRKAALVVTHALIGGGVLLLLFTGQDQGAAVFVASSLIAGMGYGLSFSLVAEVAVSAVPSERAGAAGAIAETSNELGNALGAALLGSLAALIFRLLGPGAAGTLDETLMLPGLSPALADQAQAAFVAGLHAAAGVGGALTLLVALIAARLRRA